MTWGWFYLIMAILASVAGGSCLKLSAGFTQLIPSILIFVFYGVDILALSLSFKELDMGIIYAIWTGLSTTLLTLIGFFWFKEPADLLKVLSIGLIIVGSVILKTIE